MTGKGCEDCNLQGKQARFDDTSAALCDCKDFRSLQLYGVADSGAENAAGNVERHDPIRGIDDLADLQVAGGAERYPGLL